MHPLSPHAITALSHHLTTVMSLSQGFALWLNKFVFSPLYCVHLPNHSRRRKFVPHSNTSNLGFVFLLFFVSPVSFRGRLSTFIARQIDPLPLRPSNISSQTPAMMLFRTSTSRNQSLRGPWVAGTSYFLYTKPTYRPQGHRATDTIFFMDACLTSMCSELFFNRTR